MNDLKQIDAQLVGVQTINSVKQDVDILNYIYAIFDAKWFILLCALVCAGLSMLYARSLPETFQGVVRVDIVDTSDPGGVRPDNRQMQESIGMLEYDFLLRANKENHVQSVIAHMRSKLFTRQFLDTHNVYRHIYPNAWNSQTEKWNEDFYLDKGLAQKIFKEEYIEIVHAPETDIVAVRIINKDPATAAQLANFYVRDFNEYMRENTLKKVNTKLKYLEQTLSTTDASEIQQMIFRLIEAQTAAAMLANGRKEYILEVLDPAVRPYQRHSPKRKLMSILGGVAGLLLSISLVMILTIIGKIRQSLREYAIETGRKPVTERNWGLRAWLHKISKLLRRVFRKPATDASN